jgi:uncharacterized alpha-E superfamily protein
MGIISAEKMSNLYWLGRYVERTHATLRLYMGSFDRMIDSDGSDYRDFCHSLGIPDVYACKEAFIKRYPFAQGHPNSIASNYNRAFDNAVVMRDYLGSETLAYLQMELYDLSSAENNEERSIIFLQSAIDHILAFWGCLDDIIDEATRNIVKLGKQVERLDLHLRLGEPPSVLNRDYMQMESRIGRTPMRYDRAALDTLGPMIVQQDATDHKNALRMLGKLVRI